MWIPEYRVGHLETKIDKINRKAEKLGTPPVGMTLTGEEETREFPDGDTVVRVKMVEVEVFGEAPSVDGWEFIAKLEHHGGENIVFVLPGKSLPIRFRLEPGVCEHCNYDRNRKDTFVLFKDDEYIQVGRNCLADFLGGQSPEDAVSVCANLASLWRDLGDDLDEEEANRVGQAYLDPKVFLTRCCAAIRTEGYTNKEAAWLQDKMTTASYGWDPETPVEDVDREKAKAIMEWVEALSERTNLSDYEYNLVTIARVGVTAKNGGIFASAPVAYERAMHADADIKNEHFGVIGERSILELTYLGQHTFDSRYGPVTIQKFLDPERRLAVWKTAKPLTDLKTGEKVTVVARIKDHTYYQDNAQTLLTRVKIS